MEREAICICVQKPHKPGDLYPLQTLFLQLHCALHCLLSGHRHKTKADAPSCYLSEMRSGYGFLLFFPFPQWQHSVQMPLLPFPVQENTRPARKRHPLFPAKSPNPLKTDQVRKRFSMQFPHKRPLSEKILPWTDRTKQSPA